VVKPGHVHVFSETYVPVTSHAAGSTSSVLSPDPTSRSIHGQLQWRNDGVAAASSDGGPTGGRGPPIVLFYFKSERRGPGLRK